MKKPLVSVIIPVYGAEKYLRQCVDSVLAQTYDNLEIVLVDDGSQDRSGEICEEYREIHSHIKVIHQANGGLSVARNRGIEEAAGDYYTFIDADDFIHPQCIDYMVRMAVENSAEVACVDLVDYIPDSPLCLLEEKSYEPVLSSGLDYIRDALYQTSGNSSACGKLYMRELFDSLRFTPKIGYEDLDLFYRLLLNVKRVSFLKAGMYYYRRNPESYLHKFNLGRVDVLDVTDRMVQYMLAYCPTLYDAARSRRLSAHFNIYCLISLSEERNRDITGRCKNVIKRERGRFLLNPKTKLKNRLGILITYIGGFPLLRFLAKFFYK